MYIFKERTSALPANRQCFISQTPTDIAVAAILTMFIKYWNYIRFSPILSNDKRAIYIYINI